MVKYTLGMMVSVMLLLAPVAMADVININSIVDGWNTAVDGSSVLIVNTVNPGTDSIRWGTDLGSGQSGYDWNSRDVDFNVVTDTNFILGNFTHVNVPIASGTSITSVNLDFAVGTFISPATLSTTFTFLHNETLNDPGNVGCIYGGVVPCPDVVTITNGFLDAPITYGTGQYYFTLLGFSNDGINFSNDYLTLENTNNTTQLYATITTAPSVPEPTSLILLGTGLSAIGLVALRRKK